MEKKDRREDGSVFVNTVYSVVSLSLTGPLKRTVGDLIHTVQFKYLKLLLLTMFYPPTCVLHYFITDFFQLR